MLSKWEPYSPALLADKTQKMHDENSKSHRMSSAERTNFSGNQHIIAEENENEEQDKEGQSEPAENGS
jgi:hypothetical protein